MGCRNVETWVPGFRRECGGFVEPTRWKSALELSQNAGDFSPKGGIAKTVASDGSAGTMELAATLS
jgi:hypothetical protein